MSKPFSWLFEAFFFAAVSRFGDRRCNSQELESIDEVTQRLKEAPFYTLSGAKEGDEGKKKRNERRRESTPRNEEWGEFFFSSSASLCLILALLRLCFPSKHAPNQCPPSSSSAAWRRPSWAWASGPCGSTPRRRPRSRWPTPVSFFSFCLLLQSAERRLRRRRLLRDDDAGLSAASSPLLLLSENCLRSTEGVGDSSLEAERRQESQCRVGRWGTKRSHPDARPFRRSSDADADASVCPCNRRELRSLLCPRFPFAMPSDTGTGSFRLSSVPSRGEIADPGPV